jgi:hypothetical protein
MSSETCPRGLVAQVWQVLTWGDRLLILALAVASAILLVGQSDRGHPGVSLRVEVGGKTTGGYPLADDQVLRVQGPLGVSQVEIAGRAVRVLASPCREQLCVRQGWVRNRGEVVVCVPNQLLLQIDGAQPGADLDAVSR